MSDIGCWHIGAAVVAVGFVYILVKGPTEVLTNVIKRFLPKSPNVEAPADTVLLYQFHRGTWTPCVSPFCLKLETYLRMAGIPYKNALGLQFGPKGKLPWMQYNGETVADSELCISYLKDKTGIDLNKGICKEKLAAAHSFVKMLEESVFRYFGTHLWARRENILALDSVGVPRFFQHYVSRQFRLEMDTCGYNGFNEEERDKMLDDDLGSISDYLGGNKFFLGNEPTDIDCAMFGMLYPTKVYFKGSLGQHLIEEKYQNIDEYLERMKNTFWSDWDDCITHGGTRKATK